MNPFRQRARSPRLRSGFPLLHLPLFLSLLLIASPHSPAQVVRIEELMSSNADTLRDENGDSSDWFELLNPGTTAVDLNDWALSDLASRPRKWVLNHLTLAAGERIVVFASGKDRQPTPADALPPTGLPGLAFWFRADAVNPDDPQQVRRSAGNVLLRRWNDQSANELHASQSDSASQPAWIAPTANGNPAVRFDGSNDLLLLPRPAATNSFCLFVVFRTSQSHEVETEGSGGVGGTSGQHYLFGSQHGGDFNAGTGLSVGTNGVSIYEHGSGYMPAIAVWQGSLGPNLSLVTLHYDDRQPGLDIQGIPARVGPRSPRALVTAPVEIGRGAYGAFAGDVTEILGFNRALNETERRGIASYLAQRHGLAIAYPRHTNFQLSAGGEVLLLSRPDGSVADHVVFPAVPRDVSYGRNPAESREWLFFGAPTPGQPNTTPGAREFLAAPTFSHEAGFYPQPFDLHLALAADTFGADIRYTLDGAEPTETSPLYTAPLRIRGRSGTPNGISMIPTVPGGPLPSGEVAKAWVVRTRAFKSGAFPSPIVTRTFWVDGRGRNRYSLPVLSLSTDPANFFDNDRGIYVPGNAPNGNYSQRGPEWERPAHIELIETNNTVAFSQEAGVKIHGNTSQGFPIKGLDLDGTSGRARQPFRYPIFPGRSRAQFEHFLLRPTGHDQQMAFMRDELMQGLATETGAESQADRPCVLFVNGEYWGLHYLKEKEDVEFVAYHADHPADDLDYLEGYAAAKAGDVTHYAAMVNFLAQQDLTLPDVYAQAQTLLEVPNYIDYKACEIFFYRWDIGNHRLWRPRTPDGRWRWLQFDNDVGWGGFWAEQPAWAFDMLAADLNPTGSLHGHNNETTTFLLRRLLTNGDFQRDFINRFTDLLNTTFHPSNTVDHINRRAAVLAPEMVEHIRRWRAPGSITEWQNNIQYLRNYALNRPGYMRQHLRQQFGLREPARLTLAVSHPHHGSLQVNSLTLNPHPTNSWSGDYFKAHPLTLTALPQPGFRFAGWEGLLGVQIPQVTLRLNGDLTLLARFEADPSVAPRLTILPGPSPTTLRLKATGPPGLTCQLESSTTLLDWTRLQTLTLDPPGESILTLDLSASPNHQFYRLSRP